MTDAATTRAPGGPLPLAALAAFVANQTGLRAALLAFVMGAVGAFGQAPFHLWPLTMAMFTLFVWQIDGAAGLKKRVSAGFWRGWCLGFGYFFSGLWWVGSAFLADAETYAKLIPLAVTIMPAGLALFWGLIGALAAWIWRRDWRRIPLMAVVFFVVEYLRGHVLTGFPWSLAGQVWPAGGAISQSVSVFGAYGLTLLTLFAFMAPAALAAPSRRFSMSVTPTMASIVVFLLLFVGGHARLMTASAADDGDVRLRIVQAQIDQSEKYRPENRDEMRDHYLRLSTRPGVETRTHILWAEAALPVYLLDDPRTLDAIARTIGDGHVLLTGLARRDVSTPLVPRYYNSFAAISIENGTPIPAAIYDKVKLVPFGEYTPFVGLLSRIAPQAMIAFANGYSPGPGKATVPIPGAPSAAPQICYEVVFPGFTPRGAERPGWIINVTNDSWYRGTPGPAQLFNQARFRAIEEGLPLARASSGGTSALVDPYGRAIGLLTPDADDVIDADLPAALPPTLYAMLGDAPVYLMVLFGLFVGVARRRAAR